VTHRAFHLDVPAPLDDPDAGFQTSTRDRSERVEVRDARTREAFPAAELHLLRNASDGRRDLRGEDAPQIGERRRATEE
jgi:hypothetical protein